MQIVAVLALLVVLRWALVFVGAVFLIPRVRSCPACFADTVAVRRPWLRRLLPLLQWRWCAACGWEGPSSRDESELVPAPGHRRAERRRPEERKPDPSVDQAPGTSPQEWKNWI